jgi:hypothetical protein
MDHESIPRNRREFDLVRKFASICQVFLNDFDGGLAWQGARRQVMVGRAAYVLSFAAPLEAGNDVASNNAVHRRIHLGTTQATAGNKDFARLGTVKPV